MAIWSVRPEAVRLGSTCSSDGHTDGWLAFWPHAVCWKVSGLALDPQAFAQ
jgi:hypothetical protein